MEEQKLTVELTISQWNTVLASLGEIPLKNGVDTFNAIRAQADAQVAALVAASSTETEAQPS